MNNQELKREILISGGFEEADRIVRQHSNCQSHYERIQFLKDLFNLQTETGGNYEDYTELLTKIVQKDI